MHVIIGENLHDADYVERYTEGFDGLRERVREWTPQRAAELTGIAGRRDRRAGARIRHHAAGGHPPELRRAAQRARRHGGAHHRAAAGAHRLVEGGRRRLAAFHLAGVPLQPRRRWSAPICSSVALGREARIVNMTELGEALTDARRAAGEGAGGVQLQPGGHRAQSERGAGAACAATTCSPWCWNSSRTTPPITPTSCCPPPPSWNTPICTSPTATTTCNWRARRSPAPGEARSNVEVFRAAGRAHGLRRPVLRAIPKTT